MTSLPTEIISQLDDILKKLVEINQANGRIYINSNDARLYFPEWKNLNFLFLYLRDFEFDGHSIVKLIGSKTSKELYITEYTKLFVDQGGFKNIYENLNTINEKKEFKENRELNLIQAQLEDLEKIPKRVNFNRIATLISIGVAILSLIISCLAYIKS